MSLQRVQITNTRCFVVELETLLNKLSLGKTAGSTSSHTGHKHNHRRKRSVTEKHDDHENHALEKVESMLLLWYAMSFVLVYLITVLEH